MSTLRGVSWDELLVQLAATPRNEPAWTEAYQRLEKLARFVPSASARGNRDVAAEIAGRVLAKLHQAPALLGKLLDANHRGDPKSYLIAMACHAAVDLVRERRRGAVGRAASLPDPEQLASLADAPWEEAAQREQALKLHEILQSRLTAEQRQILRWRFWEDRPIAFIAQTLGVAYHAAAMRLFRIQQQLLEIVQGMGWEK